MDGTAGMQPGHGSVPGLTALSLRVTLFGVEIRKTESIDSRKMVRREADQALVSRGGSARRVVPAGASPVPVSAEAPGSRSQVVGRESAVRAGRQKPMRRQEPRSGKRSHGPQHEVKPAASTELQTDSRAAHFTAKAKSGVQESERAPGVGGVRGAARGEGTVRNTRDPSSRSKSGQAVAYKPKAKSCRGERESEGIVVPERPVGQNAGRGKGPWGGRVDAAGKREGMAAASGPNDPIGRKPMSKVRQLQRRLWSAAKRSPGRRFHALYDQISRRDVLEEAWKRVRKNGGTAGVDRETIAAVEERGVEEFLEQLQTELQSGTYRPKPVMRRYILKRDGKKRRPLGIPAVRDRVVQMAVKLVLEPIFEADFLPVSFGFRPRRSATGALETLRRLGAKGHHHVLDADIKDYFGSIDHDKLMKLLRKRLSDRRVLKLLQQWLEAGVMEDGSLRSNDRGTPQGGVISPLLSNIYLHVLDTLWVRHSAPLGKLVRYADDFVVICRTRADCVQAESRIRVILDRLSLELHPEKTRRVDLYDGREGFDFLGCHLHKRLSGPILEKTGRRLYFLQRWPSVPAMKRVRQRIRELTPRSRCHADLRGVIASLNPVLRGWGEYFRTGNAAKRFNQLDSYVYRRLRKLRQARKGRQLKAGDWKSWTRESFENLGLHRLRGTVRYPGRA
jgi:RNA-directed DNA polymerase